MILLWLWGRQISLDCKMLSWPHTLQRLLARFTSMVWSKASESIFLILLDFSWSSWFLKPKQNLLNHLATVLGSTVPSPFAWQIFLVASMALLPSLNLWSISFYIRLCSMFLCAAFKSHAKWSNAQCVSTQTTMILPTKVGTFHGLKCFGHVIYVQQISNC